MNGPFEEDYALAQPTQASLDLVTPCSVQEHEARSMDDEASTSNDLLDEKRLGAPDVAAVVERKQQEQDSDQESDHDSSGDEKSRQEDERLDPGSKSAIKHLYRESEHDPWDAWIPDDLHLAKSETAADKAFALIVRQETNAPGEPGLALHSIVIQSPHLRDLMKAVFQGYRGIATQLSQITFSRPFHEFVYRWDDYERERGKDTDDVAKEHFKLLHDVIEPVVRPHLQHKLELEQHRIVSYSYLWALFAPDCDIFTTIEGEDRMFELVECHYLKDSFYISCRFVNTNGTGFGYQATSFEIPKFGGHKPVKELNVRPMKHVAEKGTLEKRLQKQGELFQGYTGFHYVAYSGVLQYLRPFFGWRKEHVDEGRIIIDVQLFETRNQDSRARLRPLNDESSGFPFGSSESSDEEDFMSRMFARARPRRPKNAYHDPRALNGEDEASHSLSDHQKRLCTPIVSGYCLSAKCWARFNINQIKPIRWNHFAFDHLVLPHDYKSLLLAFVKSHVAQGIAFDDIIEGKGQGMIVLLHGEPGVGKTLTAEAVAEQIKRPLYSMSAGELGWDARSVEENLGRVLEVCTKWKAVLLIDECDVFLEQRTAADLQRNELVSVFLRLLEYYKGVLFLTTNRVGTFDPAFKSRIDLNISYPSLDFPARRQIWTTFTEKSRNFPGNESSLSAQDLDTLASLELNGREIKNLVKAGRLLAQAHGQSLGMDHVRTALRVQNIRLL